MVLCFHDYTDMTASSLIEHFMSKVHPDPAGNLIIDDDGPKSWEIFFYQWCFSAQRHCLNLV